jgi:restriction endonuclease S subunit
MRLRKDKWLELEFPEAIDFQEGPGILANDFRSNGVPLIRLAGMDDGISLLNGCNYLDEELVARKYEHFRIKKGDIILSTSATLGKTSNVDEEAVGAIVYTGLVRMRPKNGNVYAPFIKYLLQSPRFIQQIESMGVGSVMKHFGPTHLKKISITLPTFDEQKTISELFPALETAMEQVDGQERNLKVLWKRLIDDFVSDKPSFGNLLKGKKLKTYNYCDVTEKLMRKIDPLTYGIERIVAGENLESEDFKIRTWQKIGAGYLGPAFHVLFKAGDILYGSRRTYLRKVSHADFDGVCANTTYVVKANKELLLQDLLKHMMLSERFTQYSIGVSKGSTNPYINWKDLDNFSFQIPDIETQKQIVKVLDSLIEIREQLKHQKTTLRYLKKKLLNEILG